MKKYLVKVKNILIRRKKKSSRNEEEQRRVKALRQLKESDLQRWSKDQVFYDDWNERSHILGSYVADGSRVIEFGAGKGVLENYFNKTITYQPVDIVQRTPNFLVCDLNKIPLSISLAAYNTAIFSGVLEYVYDIEVLFEQFSTQIPHMILSYSCSDICKQNRLTNGWLSDYTLADLKTIFKKYNYKINREQHWKDQTLFELVQNMT